MKPYVYLHTRVEKELERLKDQENTPGFAAGKARQIIRALAGGESPANAGRLSRNGDARIKNCLKYDLGKGHRLVCVKEKHNIYVLFTGSHDSCHTWMDKHRRLKMESIMEQMIPFGGTAFPVRAADASHCRLSDMEAASHDPEFPEEAPDTLPEISQKDLRIIFQGLVDAARQPMDNQA